MEWYIKALKNYAVFTGRASRQEYWMFAIFNALISILVGIITGDLGLQQVAYLYTFALIVPTIAVAIRRLHDTGRSGWWLLCLFIPIIGAIIVLVFLVQESHDDNQYGKKPLLNALP